MDYDLISTKYMFLIPDPRVSDYFWSQERVHQVRVQAVDSRSTTVEVEANRLAHRNCRTV